MAAAAATAAAAAREEAEASSTKWAEKAWEPREGLLRCLRVWWSLLFLDFGLVS